MNLHKRFIQILAVCALIIPYFSSCAGIAPSVSKSLYNATHGRVRQAEDCMKAASARAKAATEQLDSGRIGEPMAAQEALYIALELQPKAFKAYEALKDDEPSKALEYLQTANTCSEVAATAATTIEANPSWAQDFQPRDGWLTVEQALKANPGVKPETSIDNLLSRFIIVEKEIAKKEVNSEPSAPTEASPTSTPVLEEGVLDITEHFFRNPRELVLLAQQDPKTARALRSSNTERFFKLDPVIQAEFAAALEDAEARKNE